MDKVRKGMCLWLIQAVERKRSQGLDGLMVMWLEVISLSRAEWG